MAEPYYKQHWIDIEQARLAAYDQILNWHPAMEPLVAPLELQPGLRVLDAGSGPAYTTIELARRVGAKGSVVGVDINREFVDRATELAKRERLSEITKFVASPFPPLPFESASFDRVWCKNVLEYVDSAADTVADFARVLSKSGIAVAVDSDWEMLALEIGNDAAERDLNDRILRAARKVALKEPRIGRMLHGLFSRAGLADLEVRIFAGADQVGRSMPMLRASLARYALDSGEISEADVSRWLAVIEKAIASRTFLFVLPQFVVRGRKAG